MTHNLLKTWHFNI